MTGAPINYLSGNGLAESIGLDNKTVIPKYMPQGLKAMLGEDFTTIQKRFKMDSGGASRNSFFSSPNQGFKMAETYTR